MRGNDFRKKPAIITTIIAGFKASPFPPLAIFPSVPPGVFLPVAFGREGAMAGVSPSAFLSRAWVRVRWDSPRGSQHTHIFLWKVTHLEIPEKTEKFGNSLTQCVPEHRLFLVFLDCHVIMPVVLSWPFVREEIVKVLKWVPGKVSGDNDGGLLWRCYGCAGEARLKRSARVCGNSLERLELWEEPFALGLLVQDTMVRLSRSGRKIGCLLAWCSTQRLSTCGSQWFWFRGAAG